MVIDDGRAILGLSFLTDDRVSLIAAWPHDIDRFGRELYAVYRQKFPAIDALSQTPSNAQDMDVEKVLAAIPDAVLASTHRLRAQRRMVDNARELAADVDTMNGSIEQDHASIVTTFLCRALRFVQPIETSDLTPTCWQSFSPL